jgi:Tfp pilus assembly protein PilF
VWDDYEYVVQNPHVRSGLTIENAVWAFTSTHASNWHPLTWLSHMLDCELYGLNPAGHHLNNLLLHLANTLLLFALFARMTRALRQSAFVAAIFALHPLHVESVAWVAERKDLLSTFFLMLTCMAYLRYTRHPDLRSYLLCIVLFALGLASKPMLVTLPFLLLLLDYWPLCRSGTLCSDGLNPSGAIKFSALVREKVPFFVLAAISSVVTFHASIAGQTVAPLDILPTPLRIGNGLVSYSAYIVKTFWPVDLAFFYPHPLGSLSLWKVAGSSILLMSISLIAIKAGRKCPSLIVGWLWYLITLLPVIGLIQVGSQAMADRYSYLPMVGLSIMAAWGVTYVLRRRISKITGWCLGSIIVLLLCVQSSRQIDYWRDGETLFQRALEVTTRNYTAHYQLGTELMRQGKTGPAIHHFTEAVRFRPDHLPARHNLGIALASLGRLDDGLAQLNAALRLQPRHAGILSSIGDLFLKQNKLEKAITFYSEALRIDPTLRRTHNNVGLALFRNGMTPEAEMHFKEALRINPGDQKALQNLQMMGRKQSEGTSDPQQ